MKLLITALLLVCIFPGISKSQSSHHNRRNNYVKLFKENVEIGEGILYDMTDSSFIVYDDNLIGKHDTIIDKSLLKSYSFHDVQLVKINSGNDLGSLMVGGLIGGATGSLIGYGLEDVGSNDQSSIDRSHNQVVGFIIGFIVGGVTGAIPGYIVGNKQREQVLINYDYSNFISEMANLKSFCFKNNFKEEIATCRQE